MRFDGKTVLVTGGGGGIGRAAAIEFAREGAEICVADFSEEAAHRTVRSVEQEGGKAWWRQVDLSSADPVTRLFAEIRRVWGHLDVAVNDTESTGREALLEELDHRHFERAMALEVGSLFLCMQAQIRLMKGQGFGAIVNVAGLAGHEGMTGCAADCAAKHAVLGLTKVAALENARANLQISAISPGAVATETFEARYAGRDAELQALLDTLPRGRPLQPAEVARAILYLASPEASQFIGQSLRLDGGCADVKPSTLWHFSQAAA